MMTTIMGTKKIYKEAHAVMTLPHDSVTHVFHGIESCLSDFKQETKHVLERIN